MSFFSSTDGQVETVETADAAAAEAEPTAGLVAVVRVPFEITGHCPATGPGSLLRPGAVETRQVQPGVYPVVYERCACGELEATVTFDAQLVSRTTGPWWRRRTTRTTQRVKTTDVVSGPADDIHEGRIIRTDPTGHPVAYFAHVTTTDPTPYEDLF